MRWPEAFFGAVCVLSGTMLIVMAVLMGHWAKHPRKGAEVNLTLNIPGEPRYASMSGGGGGGGGGSGRGGGPGAVSAGRPGGGGPWGRGGAGAVSVDDIRVGGGAGAGPVRHSGGSPDIRIES